MMDYKRLLGTTLVLVNSFLTDVSGIFRFQFTSLVLKKQSSILVEAILHKQILVERLNFTTKVQTLEQV